MIQPAIKEKPILFSGAMVRAILDGRKTQTRRAWKMPPGFDWTSEGYNGGVIYPKEEGKHGIPRGCSGEYFSCSVDEIFSPYGRPDDRLWVRETWQGWRQTNYEYDEWEEMVSPKNRHDDFYEPVYKADGENFPEKWQPSIFMPREYSRIDLLIKDIRVERLQDISEQDALAEGLKAITKDGGQTIKYGIPDRDNLPGNDNYGWSWDEWEISPINAYRKLWDSINAKTHPWASNPWVWVIDFERIK